MKKLLKLITILLIIESILLTNSIYAKDNLISSSGNNTDNLDNSKWLSNYSEIPNFTDNYKKWNELSNDEKEKTPMPQIFETNDNSETQNSNWFTKLGNSIKSAILSASTESKYDLRTVIPNSLVIKDQGKTTICWDYASIGALEAYLGLKNKGKVYDFSEKDLYYSTIYSNFKNNATNKYGYTYDKNLPGGAYSWANSYFTNGMGPIDDKDNSKLQVEETKPQVPVEEDISILNNKNINYTINNIDRFYAINYSAINSETIQKGIEAFKEKIKANGNVYVPVYGDNLDEYVNLKTGAMYSDDKILADHAVVIIGWDDNYSANNFNEKHKPKSNGAWIVKNSWGTSLEESTTTFKKDFFTKNETVLKKAGFNSYTDLTNSYIQNTLDQTYGTGVYTVTDEKISAKAGDNGFFYLSYEDKLPYTEAYSISNATDKKTYKNIYQNDLLGASNAFSFNKNIYLANVFTRTTTTVEYIDKVSLSSYSPVKGKFYINASSDDKNQLTQLKIKDVDLSSDVQVNAGFQSFKLESPIKLTGSKFVIAFLSDMKAGDEFYVGVESKNVINSPGNTYYKNAIINENESFIGVPGGATDGVGTNWIDTAINMSYIDSSFDNSWGGNILIKAYTTDYIEPAKDEPTNNNTIKTNNTTAGNTSKSTTTAYNISKDSTTATTTIPQTGTTERFFVILLIGIGICSTFFILYRKNKDIK